MDLGRSRRRSARWGVIVVAALLLQGLASAGGLVLPPSGFPKASYVAGDPVAGERKGKAVLLHAQWFDEDGEPHKYFRGTKRFPWPKATKVSGASFRIRLNGVRYPDTLEIGVFRRTGPAASPVGKHEIYRCTFDPEPDPPCRWVPSVEGPDVWDVVVNHEQRAGHLYIVAVGSWDDPRDPPAPVGTRSQIATWIMHAKLAS